jgi:hypothetical protein
MAADGKTQGAFHTHPFTLSSVLAWFTTVTAQCAKGGGHGLTRQVPKLQCQLPGGHYRTYQPPTFAFPENVNDYICIREGGNGAARSLGIEASGEEKAALRPLNSPFHP